MFLVRLRQSATFAQASFIRVQERRDNHPGWLTFFLFVLRCKP